ncbi:unnamed protein product [Ectocarpus sp. 6 AP-2014]
MLALRVIFFVFPRFIAELSRQAPPRKKYCHLILAPTMELAAEIWWVDARGQWERVHTILCQSGHVTRRYVLLLFSRGMCPQTQQKFRTFFL